MLMSSLKSVLIQPVLPDVSGIFGSQADRQPVVALETQVDVAIVIRRGNLAAEHFKRLHQSVGMVFVVKVSSPRLGQFKADRRHTGIFRRIQSDRVDPDQVQIFLPLNQLLIGIDSHGLPVGTYKAHVNVPFVFKR